MIPKTYCTGTSGDVLYYPPEVYGGTVRLPRVVHPDLGELVIDPKLRQVRNIFIQALRFEDLTEDETSVIADRIMWGDIISTAIDDYTCAIEQSQSEPSEDQDE
jgi:hypothetical protein